MSKSEEINSMKTDKLEGMEAVMEMVKSKGHDLRLIVHLREDENGHHIFTVHYDPRQNWKPLVALAKGDSVLE